MFLGKFKSFITRNVLTARLRPRLIININTGRGKIVNNIQKRAENVQIC